MRWRLIDNNKRVQPKHGDYSDWKQAIAIDCCHQCVYCAINTANYGGLDNFHVEHFRPKSKFPELRTKVGNLYLACAICNRFKSNDWPNEPAKDHSLPAYLDPGDCDYCGLIDIDVAGYGLVGKTVASKYVVERLYLNRPQLIRERRLFDLLQRTDAFTQYFTAAIGELKNATQHSNAQALLGRLATALLNLAEIHSELRSAQPYAMAEIQRPAKRSKKAKTASPSKLRKKSVKSTSTTKKAARSDGARKSKKVPKKK